MFSSIAASIERQFFYPDRTVYSWPAQFGLAVQDVWIPGPEPGPGLHGWWLPPAGFNLLTIDYRGFGQSPGTPTLDGLVADGAAALAWLRREQPGQAQRLIVIGQSLGGATASRLVSADSEGVRLLVLDCAFASYRGIASDAVRGTWMAALAPAALRALPGPERDPVTAIAQLEAPLLVVHSIDDTVVPLAHGRALFAAAPEPKRMIEVSNTSHVDGFTRPPIRLQVIDAMRAALQAAA